MRKKPKKNPSFFKIMINDFTNTLRIPSAFTMRYKRFQPMPCDKYILKANWSSCPWPVEVSKKEKSFLFEHEFDVKIYDTTGCEKKYMPKKRSLEQNSRHNEHEGSRKRSKPIVLGSSKPIVLGSSDNCLKKASAKKRLLEQNNENQEHQRSRKRSHPVSLDSQTDCPKKGIALKDGFGSDFPLENGYGCFTSIGRRKGVTFNGRKHNLVGIEESVSLRKEHQHLISTNIKKDGLDMPIKKKTSGMSVLHRKSQSTASDVLYTDGLDMPIVKKTPGMPVLHKKSQSTASATRRLRVTPQSMKQGATEVPNKFKFVSPIYRVVLKPSYVNKTFMHVSTSFARYVMKISGGGNDVSKSEWNVRLQHSDGRMWSVRLTCSKRKAWFSGGWHAFLVDNKLREGHVCVFQCLSIKQGVVEVNVEMPSSN